MASTVEAERCERNRFAFSQTSADSDVRSPEAYHQLRLALEPISRHIGTIVSYLLVCGCKIYRGEHAMDVYVQNSHLLI